VIRILVIEQDDQKDYHESPFGSVRMQEVAAAHVVVSELPDGNFMLAKSRNVIPGNVFPSVEKALRYDGAIRKKVRV